MMAKEGTLCVESLDIPEGTSARLRSSYALGIKGKRL